MGDIQSRGWHREDIKAAIRKRGTTMNDLARERGLPASTVRNALSRPVFAGEVAIAEFLGIAAHELWPDRWTPDGRRIRPRYAHKYIDAAVVDAVSAPA